MNKNLIKFGKLLKSLRIKKQLSLRQVCALINYDPSNWSKIERGKISPPSDEKVLKKWALILGLSKDKETLQEFIDHAKIAQGVIPQDLLGQEFIGALPAFFRTLRNEKPSKEEIDNLVELIRNV